MSWNYLIILFVALFACQYTEPTLSEQESVTRFSIQPNDAERVAFGDLFTDFEYIFLDESDYIIGNARSIFFHEDSLLFVFDDLNHAVLKYDMDGNLMSQLLPLGEGPGEYSAIESVTLDKKRREVVVYSSEELKLLRYDYDFNVNSEQRFELLPDYIKAVGNGNLLAFMNDIDMSGMYGHNLLFLNAALKVEDTFLEIDPRYEHISYQFWSYMSEYQDEVNVIQTFRNSVYAFDTQDKSCYQKYHFDFGRANIKPSVVDGKFIREIDPVIKRDNLFFIHGFLETNTALLVKIRSYKEQYEVYISKTTQDMKIVPGGAPDTIGILLNPLTTKNGAKFVGILSSEMLESLNELYQQEGIKLDVLTEWQQRNGEAALVCLAKYSN